MEEVVLFIKNSENIYANYKVDDGKDLLKYTSEELKEMTPTKQTYITFVDLDRQVVRNVEKINKIKEGTKDLFKEWLFETLDVTTFVPKQHIVDTPSRISRMYIDELFKFAFSPTPKITYFKNVNGDDIVKLKGIEINSMCSHHFVPFIGKADIAYIPDKRLVGLSKLPRVCQFFASKPSIQEELTIDTIRYLELLLKPKAIYYTMTCTHLCMKIRGVKSDAITVTSNFSGDPIYRDSLINGV